MPDEASSGFWAAIAAGITSTGLVIGAFLRRPAMDANAARSISIDRAQSTVAVTQQQIIDGLRADLREARLWERRARRIDEIAHCLWHIVANGLQAGTIKQLPPELICMLPEGQLRLPFLEDPV